MAHLPFRDSANVVLLVSRCSGFVSVITRNANDVAKFEAGEDNPRRDAAWGKLSALTCVLAFGPSLTFVDVFGRAGAGA